MTAFGKWAVCELKDKFVWGEIIHTCMYNGKFFVTIRNKQNQVFVPRSSNVWIFDEEKVAIDFAYKKMNSNGMPKPSPAKNKAFRNSLGIS